MDLLVWKNILNRMVKGLLKKYNTVDSCLEQRMVVCGKDSDHSDT